MTAPTPVSAPVPLDPESGRGREAEDGLNELNAVVLRRLAQQERRPA